MFGPFELVLNSKLIKCDHSEDLNLDVSGVKVYFYDFANNVEKVFPIDNAAEGILNIEGLDKTRKFYVVVFGYTSGIDQPITEKLRQTFKTVPNSYLIVLDHSPYTNNKDGDYKSYSRSVKHVYYIGKALGEMLAKLHAGGVSGKDMRLIGHSLGAQMIGTTGDIFTKRTGEKVARLTGLDPAGPCFTKSPHNEQLRSGLAEYVEVYHCNAGGFGTSSVLADVNFFMNRKGQAQPQCKTPLIPGIKSSIRAAKCNHSSCTEMWLATVHNPEWFVAYKCQKYDDFEKGLCMKNDKTIAGFSNPGTATGLYRVSTAGFDI